MNEEEYDENDLMFKLIRIYVVEYLSTVRKNWTIQMVLREFNTKQSICSHCTSIEVWEAYEAIRTIARRVKRMVSLQGNTMPNCLHIVDLMYRGKLVDIPNLL
jgi:hypothetical protein